jgi:hypothetical protein
MKEQILTDNQVRLLRLHAQRLMRPSSHRAEHVQEIVKEVGGIQAQDATAAMLALRVRSRGLLATDVEHARVQERSIIRTWGLRGTLHLLATEDLSWLLPLFGPVFVASSRRRREELGLDEPTCRRGMHLIDTILANQGPLTRAELVERLAVHGLRLQGQARPHLLGRAALEGIICLGPDSGSEPTYVLLNDWVDQVDKASTFSEEVAYTELTRRYIGAYGPTTPKDQAAWSGLPLSKIRQAWHSIANQLLEVEHAGAPAWMLKKYANWLDEQDTPLSAVRLLPRFDTYLLGYQNRDLVVPTRYAKRVNAGGGMIHPTMLINGRVRGTWKTVHKGKQMRVHVELFEPLTSLISPELSIEIMDLARFLATTCTWEVLGPAQG